MARRLAKAMIGPAALGATLIGVAPLLAAEPASAAVLAYGPTAPHITITVVVAITSNGGTITITFSGAVPGETFTFTISIGATTAAVVHGAGASPVVLAAATSDTIGSATADGGGNVSATLNIPAGLAPGAHTITGTGNKGDVVTTSVTVQAATPTTTAPATAAPVAAAPTPGSSGGSGLAFTGADIAASTAVGAGAIAAGGFLVLGARKRRRGAWS